MPFTFAHPAIILPLTSLPRKWFSLTGLVVGSLTPDFEYFFRMRMAGRFGHTLTGIFAFDLPTGLFLAFVFHNIVRNKLFENLPTPLASRLSAFTTFEWNRHFKGSWFVVITSIIIGAASHIFWDSFTHHGGFFVEELPALSRTVDLSIIDVKFFRILQHTGTLVGGLAIAYAIFQLPHDTKVNGQFSLKYWGTFAVTASMVMIIRLFTGLDYHSPGNIVVNIISAGMISLILTPFVAERFERLKGLRSLRSLKSSEKSWKIEQKRAQVKARSSPMWRWRHLKW